MQLLNSQTFKGLLIAFLCLSWGAKAQVAVNSAVAQSEVHFANNTNFEIGTLTIKIKLPTTNNTAEVTVTLPTGIEYVVGSEVRGANATSLTYLTTSPINKPVFTLVGTPNTEVAFTIKRKLTKAATDALAGRYLTDRVKATVTGETPDEKDSNQYRVTPPVVTVQDVVGVDGASLGENTATFGIRNTGVGYAHTIYFSVDYPANVTNVRFTPPAGVTLTHVGNVPAGFPDAGKPLYSLTKTGGFANNELVTITETYKIAPALCGNQTKIGYVPYWGFSATNLFAQNTKVDRDIKVRTYTPSVKQTQDGNKRYFVEGAGLTAATGQKLGTFYTAFKNESTDATAYNNRLNNLYQILTFFKPDNFYIIATDGTKIPVPSTFINNVNSTGFDFRNLPALADAALTGKDIGFTDEDADGFRDDLKPGAEVRICFDLVATGTPFTCNPYILSINPSFYYHYESACGETIELRDNPNVYARYFGRVNKTAFPAQLLKNAPEKGRIAPNMNSVGVFERFQGDASVRTNDIRYRYYMQLPSGIALKNVVFYYAREVDDTSVPSVAIGNIPAGGLLDFTTPETPPAGVSAVDTRLWGYLSFDIELTDCTGLSNATSIDYKVFVMNRNQGGTTFTPIPILCESVNVALGCTVPCGVNGPEMISTKVERADNSYGWTDATMTQRVQRANISAEQRRKVLHLDDIEFFAEGKQSPNAAADNLFYYTAVEKRVNLDPKFIKVKIGAHEVTLQATDPGVVTRATNANGNYYRWNLTSALPTTGLAAGQTFSVVATYQVNNPSNNSSSEEQSGKTSYFYTLADKNDPAVSPQGYHTNALRCGLDLIPVFTFANTGIAYGMNGFGVSACTPSYIGGRFIHFGRAQNSGSNLYTEEYRPGILMRKIVLKIPLSYKITDNPEYFYTANIADTKKASSDQSSVITPLANWVESTEGNNRVYTYLNPVNRTDPYHLPAGIVATTYSQWLRVKVQASCKSKEFTGTEAAKRAAAIAAGEIGSYVVECEDYYYHYADSPTPLVVEKTNFSVMNMTSKPQLLLLARGQGSTIRANRSEQQAIFSIETRNSAAPNAWISIPDVTGMEVLGLEEVNDALATTVLHTFTPVTSISGEKMFFLNKTLPVGAANQKYYRLKFKLTNCSNPQMKFKVYAGWNCEGNPTGGLREACDENFLEYTVNIAQSKKEIEVGSSPASLPMCTQTPFEYIVKSTDEGDIFGANLIVTQQPGIIISDVEVEYPLNSGKVYNTATLVDGKKIGVTTVGGKTTYQLSDILPGGSLPGSVSTNIENEQKFKVRFKVQPDCNFVSGSSFDIDLEGNNLCGVPAIGPKIVAIVAGVQGASVNNYNVLLSTIDYISGNANACDLGATYKVRVVVNATPANPSFEIGDNARLHIRFPQSYDIQNTDITINRTAFPQASVNWATPTIESRNVVGNETEILMVVPKGMKDTHYFDVYLKIKQNANALVDCAVERSLKVLTTDKVTNIPCATLTPPTCPALVVSTSPERTAVIKNNRSEISFADVQVTAVPQVNKENLTVQYKLANAATASAYSGQLVVSLYNDINNNGLVDSGEVLATHTSTQSLAANATSAVQSFTFLADQSQVCRLRLAIRNEDNKCLCGNKELALPTPAHISGLVSNLTTCETESVTFAYNAAAPAYDAYTWSPASYLSAANIAAPTFLYSGTKLTSPLTVTYTLTVKRTNGCESTQTVTVLVTPNTATPSPTAVNLCSGNTVQSLKTYLGGLVSGTLKVYATATAAAELANTTALTDNTTYYYSAQVAGECESTRQSILVKITTMPTVSSSYTYCAGTKVATLWDAIDPTDSDRLLRIYTTATGGAPLDRTDLLQAGNYYVAKIAKNGANITCETPRALTTVHIPTVATPTVSATPALCPTTAAGSVSFAGYVTAAAGNTLRWYATATDTTPLAAAPTISTQVANSTSQTAYVSQVTAAGCESGRAVITLVVNDTTPPTLNAPAPLVVDCHNAAANINTWLNSATATDSCGTVSLTNTYNAPADFCNVPSGTLTISFVAKDPFGNTTTQTRTITLINIKAENDTFTVTHGAVATTTAGSVLTNDKVGTQTATAATVSMTVVTPATGVTGSATPTLNADGTVTVPAGTKSDTYQIGYKICQTVAAVTVCDTATATIVVGAPTITATPDTFTITTGTSTSSVIDNDHIGTATTTTSTVSIGVVTGATPKTPGANTPSLNTTDGTITVPNNTPAGTYSIVYQICEKLNPGNCATSTAEVTVATPTITATPDTFTITTGTSTSSVIDNDHIGTATTTTSTVSIGVVTGATPKTPGANTPSLNTTDGTITVPNNTPAGTYSIVYQICEKLNPGNCATSTAVVTVATPTITATPDTFTITTGTSTSSVIDNDHIGTATTTTSTVSIGVVTGATPKTPGANTPSLNTTDGTITVPNNTPAGTYSIVYQICEKLNPGNCATSTAVVTVATPTITATPDTFTITTGTSTSSVIDNDHIGTATTTTSTVSIGVVTGATPKTPGANTPSLNPTDGTITVPNNTPAGTYSIVYQICEKLNPGNCATSTAVVTVATPTITATPDTFTITTGTSTSSVIDNDHIGTATTTTGTVTIGVVTGATPKTPGANTPSLNTTDGTITVPNNTPAGTYSIVYQICEKLNPGNCATSTAVVTVATPTITATPDTFTITTGTSTSSVIDNDHIGTATTTTSTVSIGVVTGATPKTPGANTPSLNTTDGTITVPNNTPAGTYSIVYQICEKLNPGNCATSTAVVTVATPTITATPDTFTITTGTSTSSVIDNDHIGTATTTTSTVSIGVVTGATPKTPGANTPSLNTTDGTITVPNNTPAGTYSIVYQICEKLNPGNCATSTAVVTVATPTITATPDTFTITTGTSTSSVIDNDHIGTATTTTSTVSIGVVTGATPKTPGANTPTLNPTDGTITVPNNTPAGTYSIVYQICEKLNPGNCATSTVVVTVATPTITATPDTFTITTGTSTSSVIDNDHIGTATTTTSTVSIGVVTGATPKTPGANTPSLNTTDGTITVPNNTPAGTYSIVYQICEKLNPGNCATATAEVTVATPTITATPDTFTITTGTSTSSVIDNDHIGTATTTTSTVSIGVVTGATPKTPGANTPSLNTTDGTITVPNNTPAGTYSIVYQICEKLNPGNCATATVVVTVATPTITATPDTFTITTGTSTSSVIENDHIGTATTTTSTVSIGVVTGATPKTPGANTPSLNTTDGTITVPNNTPAGTYSIVYQICEKLNPGNCSTATIIVVVPAQPTVTPTVEATSDSFVHNGIATQTTVVGNVLTNDKLNGNLNPSVHSVTITTPLVSSPRVPYLHPATGEVIVPPHTPAGVYEIPYTICALASPTVCDTATAVVTVNSIEAHNDGRHLLGTTVGGTISSVLANDKLNGRTPTASEVTIHWQATPAGFTYNADGSITVAAGTAVGTYTISYTLCATATPTLCSERAEVVVAVTAAVPVPPLSITAVYDGVYYIERGTATTLTSVLANDLLDSDPATTGNVSLTWDISAPAGFTLNADGTAHVATDTAVGRYEIPYTICAKNGTLCSTTKLVVTVLAPTVTPTIEVNGETFTYTGNPTVGNVLTNEKLNGTPNPSVRSVTISIMPPPPGAYEPYLDPSTGDVIVPPHTPSGSYTVTYRVCTIDTPVACGVASVVVVIPATPPTPTPTVVPVAVNDSAATPRNTPVTIDVLSNDTPNGATTPNVVTVPQNGTAVVNPDGTIEYTPHTGFKGVDTFVYELCNADGCATATVSIEVTHKLIVYNGISVGGDKNNHFHIAGIEAYPNNTVRIYNRWGVKVWEAQSYDNVRNVFKGISNGRVTIEAADKLPQGTYYYVIEYVDENNQKQTMVGWLYLKKD